MKDIFAAVAVAASWLAGLAVAGLAGLYLIAKLGTVNEYYRCPGKLESPSVAAGYEDSTAYLRMQTYSPLMFWAKDSGMLWVETSPQGDFVLIQKMLMNSELMTSFHDGANGADFSKISRVAHIRLAGDRYFMGECAPVDR